MEISPVYEGAPTQRREGVEQAVYDLLEQLHIPLSLIHI